MQPPFGLCFSSTNFIFRTWDHIRLKQLELGSPKMALDPTFNSIIGWDPTFKAKIAQNGLFQDLGGLFPPRDSRSIPPPRERVGVDTSHITALFETFCHMGNNLLNSKPETGALLADTGTWTLLVAVSGSRAVLVESWGNTPVRGDTPHCIEKTSTARHCLAALSPYVGKGSWTQGLLLPAHVGVPGGKGWGWGAGSGGFVSRI